MFRRGFFARVKTLKLGQMWGGGKSVKEKLLSWVRSGEDDEEEHEVGDVKPAAQN